jgi:hypothetical protein
LLVSTSACPLTTDAEQPVERRTAAPRMWSSHAWSMCVPYLAFTAAIGKLSKVHMPSSANAEDESRTLLARSGATSLRFM